MANRMAGTKLRRGAVIAVLSWCGFAGFAQTGDDLFAQALRDSVLTYKSYLDMVKRYHPVAEVARLELEFAEADLQRSRGGFDPSLYGNYSTKQFKEVGYYEDLNAGIVIPTWMGLSFQAGYQTTGGDFLNPEKVTPGVGLINAGFAAQLGAGLLMDSRRAALRQAQIGVEQGQIDRLLLLNKLYYEATQAYYRWSLADQALRIAEEALDLATFRYDAVRESFRYGDVPAIDTVEAYTQVLNRLYRLREAQTSWVESVNIAGVYIWDQDRVARQIPPGLRPTSLNNRPDLMEELSLAISDDHPELRRLENMRGIIDIDRRLAAEYLRPTIEVKYNFLTENVVNVAGQELFENSQFFVNNYDFGARVAWPIFMREARGRLGMNKIRMSMVEQDYFNQRAILGANLDAALVELKNLRDQIQFFATNVDYLGRLLEGERELFLNGESSLFLINARESQLVDGQNIYYELLAKEHILYAEIRVIAGEGFPQQ